MNSINAHSLKTRLWSKRELAFLDIRERGQHSDGHPFNCVNLPFSILENHAPELIPVKSTPMVLMDGDGGIVRRAVEILTAAGYREVGYLQGGIRSWIEQGYGVFEGINTTSEAFGGLARNQLQAPSLSSKELKEKLDGDENLVVLDARSDEAYQQMSIPQAHSCPNAELAYRLNQFVGDDATPVVVYCTSGNHALIGVESLRQAGIQNPLYVLRDGILGWQLAGYALIKGKSPTKRIPLQQYQLDQTATRAASLIQQNAIPITSAVTLAEWLRKRDRTTYLFDIRTREEFDATHLNQARHVPGGQLIEETDEYIAVRNARIVLCDNTGLRAATTAKWLRHMGHDVSILDTDVSEGIAGGPAAVTASPQASISIQVAAQLLAGGALLLDASRSRQYRQLHIAGACWVTRARLDRLGISPNRHVIVTAQDPLLITGIINDLAAMGIKQIDWFYTSTEAWQSAGMELETDVDRSPEEDEIDCLPHGHDSQNNNRQALHRYLAWKVGLVNQLDIQERAQFEW